MSHGVVAPARRRRLGLTVLADLFVTVGAVALLYVAWTVLVADAGTRAGQAEAAAALHATWSEPRPAGAAVAAMDRRPRPGQAFAVLYVPRFGGSWRRPVVEGTTLADLDRGAAHYPDTAMPGAIGNFAVAGHRLTHGSAFLRIADLRDGDPILVETPTTWYLYRVTSSLIVDPDRIDVLDPVPEQPGQQPTRAVLTLTSCNPLFGHTQRYIVHADLVTSSPHAVGRPAV